MNPENSVVESVSPCESKFVQVKKSRIHYLECGNGDPILFIHGMPTHSYLWRHIIPFLSDKTRCIAPDLIGMGASDKPDIEYRVFDHIEYLEEFIRELDLKNITLVLHGWGSVIGFDYARRNPDNIKALAFYEAHIHSTKDWNMLSLPVQQFATLLKRRHVSYRAVVLQNYLVNKLLPNAMIRSLSEQEMEIYRKPFSTPESRKPLWQYIQDLPLGNDTTDVTHLIDQYSEWLKNTDIQKLMFYAIPGFMTTMETVGWGHENLKNLTLVELENALHFAQESAPEIFGKNLRAWYLHLPQ